MTVYIEYVIVDNMAFDCILFYASARTLGLRPHFLRIVLGGAIGTACAFLSASLNGWALLFVKAAFLPAMCFAAVGRRKFLQFTAVFCAYTFLTGGAIIGLFNVCGLNYVLDSGFGYYSEVSLGFYLAGAALAAFLARCLYNFVKSRKATAHYVRQVTVEFCGNTVCCEGFIDTGNTLTFRGLPVCFAFGSLAKKVTESIAKKALYGQMETARYRTVGGNAASPVVQCEITLCGKVTKAYVAPSDGQRDCNLLLSGAFLEVCDEEMVSVDKKSA